MPAAGQVPRCDDNLAVMPVRPEIANEGRRTREVGIDRDDEGSTRLLQRGPKRGADATRVRRGQDLASNADRVRLLAELVPKSVRIGEPVGAEEDEGEFDRGDYSSMEMLR
jgi:hypothetical protein